MNIAIKLWCWSLQEGFSQSQQIDYLVLYLPVGDLISEGKRKEMDRVSEAIEASRIAKL